MHSGRKVVPDQRTSLLELAALFLRLGATAFGGPAAHVGLMEAEMVRRRGWLTHEEFLDLLGAVNLIPGPNSTEMAIHIGLRRAGWPGLLTAGICFILPAAVLVTVMAWAYVRYGSLPQITAVLYGVKPVIIAVVVQALWGLGRAALKAWPMAALGLTIAALNYCGVHELVLLSGAGFVGGAWRAVMRHGKGTVRHGFALLGALNALAVPAGLVVGTVAPFSLGALFLFFLKVGSVLFGSGYVLLAFLRADLVERWHWLSEQQLLDAVAVGQVTPGPLFTTATFIGYLLGGPSAAALATVGIFLPAFVFVALSGPLIARVRASPVAGAVLDGVNVASLALMMVVTVELAAAAVVDWPTILLALSAGVLLLRYRINSLWLVLGGAVVGLLKFLGG
jgi:chromate transporter